ncbi:MAG: acyl--CoA ligase [Pseudomonadales bacterium]|nr:acyl--CoA ligase [Halioglobus sp.]MCP5193792.1 acyl--CoA ligase [Pseudomonadales bacterium]
MPEDLLTLRDLIRRSADDRPNSEAVVDSIGRYTYSRLLDRIRRMAGLLHTLGLRKGDRVALLMPPSTSHVIALFGAIELGAIPVALHVRESEETLAAIVEQLSPRALVYDGVFAQKAKFLCDKTQLITAAVRSISSITPKNECVKGLEPIIPNDLDNYKPDIDPMPVALDDTAVIALSSGTTGIPKGVMHTHRTLMASARGGARYMAAHSRAVSINIFTTAFIGWYNCTLPFLFGGSKIIYLSRWDPQTYLQTLQDEKVTVCFLVPTMWRMLLRDGPENYNLSSLERVGYAGEPMDVATMTQIRQRICDSVINTYGTTETGSWAGCAVMLPEDYADSDKIASVGRAAANVEIRVIAPGGPVDAVMPSGEEGEVIIAGPSVASQLWEQPRLGCRIFDGRWWRSGDIGVLDDEGYLYLRGRIDDMIITGGINVLPGQVEEAVLGHPAVSECVVLGLPSEQWGAQITAFVICREQVTEEELSDFVNRTALSNYKRPREYRFVNELPRGNTGKVNRKLLRDQVTHAHSSV